MSLGTAIFASVVLILIVFNKPFRKFFFWFAGIAVVLAGVAYLGWFVYSRHLEHIREAEQQRIAAEHQRLVDDCVKRSQTSGSANTLAQLICEDKPDTDWTSVKNSDESGPWQKYAVQKAPKKPTPTPGFVKLERGIVVKFSSNVMEREQQLILDGLPKHLNSKIYADSSYLLIIDYKNPAWTFSLSREGSHFRTANLGGQFYLGDISQLFQALENIKAEGE